MLSLLDYRCLTLRYALQGWPSVYRLASGTWTDLQDVLCDGYPIRFFSIEDSMTGRVLLSYNPPTGD